MKLVRCAPGGWRRGAAAGVTALLSLAALPVLATPAMAATDRVDLRVLVVTDGDPSAAAIGTALAREGVPYTQVDLTAAGRPTVDEAFLQTADGSGRFQAVVLPNHAGGGLSGAEMAALTSYEASHRVRQVDAYTFPSAATGLNTPTYSGELDGGTATVTDAGKSAAFGYLNGPVNIDNFDTGATEVYGYLATPMVPAVAGTTFTPLLTAAKGAATGTLAGVYTSGGREELVLGATYNPSMQWFNVVAHGLVTWMTKGVHLGYQRNYLNMHIDDVFLPDSRWSIAGKCTPGDDCTNPAVTTPDIRMTAADVSRLVSWQNVNKVKLDMAFNAFGTDSLTATGTDPLATAFLANQAQFPWVNHTYSHPWLGCTQIAPTVAGTSWHCATGADEAPRQDPDVDQALGSDGKYYAAQAYIQAQVQQNIAWAAAKGLTDFDPTELVTGEHSGLARSPQQPLDNPFLVPALTATGVRYTASDASLEPTERVVGTTQTLPRHPLNIYYNTATYQEAISEYNWYYTSAANGGGGICEANPATSTCIQPLNASSNAAAKASFDSYVAPLQVRTALSFILTNDPAPFYAHQSNLTEDAILYPVLDRVLGTYRAAFNASAPLVQTDMTGLGRAMAQMTAWKRAQPQVTAYRDSAGVHISGAAGTTVPLTVPTGTIVNGFTAGAYAGERSGWYTSTATDTLVAVPADLLVAPATPSAVAGNASASVAWVAPVAAGTPAVTGYQVRVFAGTAATATRTVAAAAGARSLTVTGLANGTVYRFDVAAVYAGTVGAASGRSNAVTPSLGASLAGTPRVSTLTPGLTAATIGWTAPTGTAATGVTGYRIQAFAGAAGTTAARTVTAAATARSVAVTGLSNGATYTFEVAALYGTTPGAVSARSAQLRVGVPLAPVIGTAVAGTVGGAVTATAGWTAGSLAGTSGITGYRVTASRLNAVNVVVGTTQATAAATARSLQMTLPVAARYRFTVQAVNPAGLSTSTAASNIVAGR